MKRKLSSIALWGTGIFTVTAILVIGYVCYRDNTVELYSFLVHDNIIFEFRETSILGLRVPCLDDSENEIVRFSRIEFVKAYTPSAEQITAINNLRYLKFLLIEDSAFTDASLEEVNLQNVGTLGLKDCKITDASVPYLLRSNINELAVKNILITQKGRDKLERAGISVVDLYHQNNR